MRALSFRLVGTKAMQPHPNIARLLLCLADTRCQQGEPKVILTIAFNISTEKQGGGKTEFGGRGGENRKEEEERKETSE